MATRFHAHEPLLTLLQHHLWANLRILEACRQVPIDDLEATAPGTYGTIQATIAHMIESEYGYLRLMGWPGDQPAALQFDHTDLDQLGVLIRQRGEYLVELIGSIDASTHYEVTSHGTTWQVPFSFFLTQLINHATEHRTNITTILAGVGIEAPETSGWVYYLTLQGVE